MQNKKLYEILGVPNNASKDEIKKKYRECAKKYHPDRFATASEEEKQKAEKIFRDINDAYSILSDDNKRKEYDEQLLNSRQNSYTDTFSKSNNKKDSGKKESYQDIYERFAKGNMFSNFFDPKKNKNTEEVDTTLKEKTNDMFEAYFFQGRKKK